MKWWAYKLHKDLEITNNYNHISTFYKSTLDRIGKHGRVDSERLEVELQRLASDLHMAAFG
jgi:hypothetical protein